MEFVIRAAIIYIFLLVVFRFAGKRTLSQITTFDLVLLLIISEATDNGLLGADHSFTSSMILIVTLIMLEVTGTMAKRRSPALRKLMDGLPVVIVQHGEPLKDRMQRSRIEESDVLAAARLQQGVERMEQIKYAVLERSGNISIVPDRQKQS